jgi:hypothetical protein
MSASWWIVAGGVLALFGGAFSVVGAVRNSREQEDLIRGHRHTFCQLIPYVDSSTVGWYLSTYHHGSGNIYDVDVLIREVQEDGTPIAPRRRTLVGALTSNTWPWLLYELGINGPQTQLVPRYFEAQITQRNGTSLQDVVVYPLADGRIRFGFLRLEFAGRSYDPDFRWLPRGAEGIAIPAADLQRISALRAARGRQP